MLDLCVIALLHPRVDVETRERLFFHEHHAPLPLPPTTTVYSTDHLHSAAKIVVVAAEKYVMARLGKIFDPTVSSALPTTNWFFCAPMANLNSSWEYVVPRETIVFGRMCGCIKRVGLLLMP